MFANRRERFFDELSYRLPMLVNAGMNMGQGNGGVVKY